MLKFLIISLKLGWRLSHDSPIKISGKEGYHHLEADYEWSSEVHHSKDKDGRDYEFGNKLIRQLLE